MLGRSFALLAAAASLAAAQSRTDVLKGHVTTDSGKVVADAQIIVTMAPTRVVVQGTGDSTGNYELKLPNGTGEYLVYITAVGRVPFRKRLTAVGGDSVFVVDAKLAAIPVATLATVRSVASRPRPSRTGGLGGTGSGVTGNDKSPDGVLGQLPPDLAASLEALATTLPGYTLTPNGVSTFGLGGDANQMTLNGMAMGVGDFPRDARMNTRFQSSPYDPARGGFAGAQFNANLAGGTEISRRRSSFLFDAPQLQVGQPSASLLGRKYYKTSLDYSGEGAIVPEKYFYNFTVDFTRTTSPVTSLLDLDPAALGPNGISADSARRLVQILGTQQVPVSIAGIPGDPTTTSGLFIARFDESPQPSKTPGGLTSAPWYIMAIGGLSKTGASSLSPVTIPAFASQQSSGSVGLQGFYSTYAGPARLWLSETTVGLSATTNRGDPYLDLPSGRVLVSSTLDDGTSSVQSLAFGGNSASHRRSDAWSAEIDNTTVFYPGTHTTRPIKIFAQGRYDGFNQLVSASRLGSFSFASLADLASNTPTSFSRTLNVPDRRGGEFTGAAAVGINWSIKTVNLIGGVRGDANLYDKSPPLNSVVQSTFGLATDHVPNTIALSPRLGFSWTYKPSGTSMSSGSLGTTSRGPTTFRGGIGRFRNALAPTLIADALTTTGLPGGTVRLSCIGPAAPIPDWNAYRVDASSIPTQCVGGTSTFADASPNVIAFDPRYAPIDAWRGSLGSTRTFQKRTYVSVDATYSLNLDMPSFYDLNFAGPPKFTLTGEQNRPVYVNSSSIVTSTGAVSPVEARVSPTFGRVAERRSDLRSEARQITIYTIPNANWFDPFFNASYTYADVRAKQRGFDATTDGDPRLASWAREAYTPRHRIILGIGKVFKKLALTASTSFASGTPFTPIVSGDINGDGLGNDRAFIAGPTPTDSASAPLAQAMQSLLDKAPSRVRSCLLAQANTIAKQSSCLGPWTATMNLRLGYTQSFPGIGKRVGASLNLANPLSGLDLLFHGANDLRGWGGPAYPDPTLLYVRGFNSATRSFKYEVNPRFGSTLSGTTAIVNPFRVTLSVSVNLGRDATVQQVEVSLRPPRGMGGSRAPVDTIKMRLISGGNTVGNGPQDVYKYILSLKDSLALSADQIAKLEAAQVVFRAKIDSMYTDLANYMVSLPPTFDGAAAAKRGQETSKAAWQTMADQGKPIRAILSPTQMQLLWQPVVVTLTKFIPDNFWYTSAAAWWP